MNEGDALPETILELVKKEIMCTTRLFEKKAATTCLRFATSNIVRKQFYHDLLPNGYVERVSRGACKITSKGERLLEILHQGLARAKCGVELSLSGFGMVIV